MGKIFINYRRTESLKDARHLATLLDRGPFRGRIFIDLKALDGSPDWLHELERQVAASEAMIAVICPGWADIRDDDGRRRIDNDKDFVRFELAEAFRRNIPVIPVLVDTARMPRGSDLPDNLLYLTRPQAELLRTESFDADTAKIVERVKAELKARRKGGFPGWALGAVAAGALAGGIAAGPWVQQRLGMATDPAVVDVLRQLEAERARRGAMDADLRRLDGRRLQEVNEAGVARDAALKDKHAAEQRVATLGKERDEARAALVKAQAGQAKAEQQLAVLAAELGDTRTNAKTAFEAAKRAEPELRRLAAALAAAETSEQEARTQLATLAKRSAALTGVDRGQTPGPAANVQPKPSGQGSDPMAPGRVFRDCPDVCPEMVVLPKGTYKRGSEDGDADEKPVRTVTIGYALAVGKFEVTFAEWDACVAAGGCKHKPTTEWGRGSQPVHSVSWDDITKEYLPWLNRRLGLSGSGTYRLLTEAEWEYAARGVTSASARHTTFSWGNEASHEHANYGADACCSGLALGPDKWVNTAPVGQFPQNPFGLHDMHGNVWEWVEDCYADTYNNAPTDGSKARETSACGRVVRGGSWSSTPGGLRSANRVGDPTVVRSDVLGFRVGRTF